MAKKSEVAKKNVEKKVEEPIADAVVEAEKSEEEKPKSTLDMTPLDKVPQHTVAAFKLITDAQAQRANLVNNKIIYSPLTISAFVLIISILVSVYLKYRDAGVLVLALAGVGIAFLSLIGRLSEFELKKAESMQIEDYVEASEGTESKKSPFKTAVYVYNSTVVGVISAKQDIKTGDWRITGWATLRRYRNTGLGTDLIDWFLANKGTKGKVSVSAESVELPAEHILAKKGFKQVKTEKLPGIAGLVFGLTENEWTLE